MNGFCGLLNNSIVQTEEGERNQGSNWFSSPQAHHNGAMSPTNTAVPHVSYLVLGGEDGQSEGESAPHLVASECTTCGARFFDRRNACASCFATGFRTVPIATEGIIRSFTIVTFAAPGVPVPFVAAIVDCAGTSVRGNLLNVEPSPEHVKLGMKVRLALISLGTDTEGVEAFSFGFEPVS